MEDGLAGFFTIIDYEPEIISMSFFPGDTSGNQQQMAEQVFISFFGVGHPGYCLPGDDQDMHRSLRVDITESDALIIFMYDIGRNIAVEYLAKNCF